MSFKDFSKDDEGQDGQEHLEGLTEILRGDYNDPAHREFMDCMKKSLVPPILRNTDSAGQPVPVSITVADQRQKAWPAAVVPAKSTVSFGGAGRSLGGGTVPTPTANEAPQGVPQLGLIDAIVVPAAAVIVVALSSFLGYKPSFGGTLCLAACGGLLGYVGRVMLPDQGLRKLLAPRWELIVDQNKPITTLKVRLKDSTVLTQQFNTDHTVQDLHKWLFQQENKDGAFDCEALGWKLMYDYPPKALSPGEKRCLADAGIVNCELRQM